MQKLQCKRCDNIWTYKGKNQYCANCSRCKSTIFIKKTASLSAEERALHSSGGGGGLDSDRIGKDVAQQQQVPGKTGSDFAIKE